MSAASNGKHFEVQLRAASAKLARAVRNGGIDPVSGFTGEDIYHFIIGLPLSDDQDQQAKASAVLRRNGYLND